MHKIIQYGNTTKITSPFFGDSNILQQFSMQQYTFLSSVEIYVNLNERCQHNLKIKFVILDEQENIYFQKDLQMIQVFQSCYYNIPVQISLKKNKHYFLCLDSYGQGDNNNNVSFALGYRSKMLNLFINNKFSLGQLCFKLKLNH